jgi:thiamine biosynthesis protein ThiC
MPLGPIATDIAENYDNIAAVIGATQMAMDNCAHLLNSITRDEHKPGIPTKDSIIEGLRCAQIVAHCINIAKFNTVQKDQETYELRAKYHSCNILKKDSLAIDIDNLSEFCSRCGSICPLRILTK